MQLWNSNSAIIKGIVYSFGFDVYLTCSDYSCSRAHCSLWFCQQLDLPHLQALWLKLAERKCGLRILDFKYFEWALWLRWMWQNGSLGTT